MGHSDHGCCESRCSTRLKLAGSHTRPPADSRNGAFEFSLLNLNSVQISFVFYENEVATCVECSENTNRTSIFRDSYRGHFGSRCTLGCCRHVSLFFCAGSIPAAFTLLQQQGKLCAVTPGPFAELHFWQLPPWLPNPAQPSAQHAQH